MAESRKKLRDAGATAVRPEIPDDINHVRGYPNKWTPGHPRPFTPSFSFAGREQEHPGDYLVKATPGRTAATSNNGVGYVKNVIKTSATNPKR